MINLTAGRRTNGCSPGWPSRIREGDKSRQVDTGSTRGTHAGVVAVDPVGWTLKLHVCV